MSKFELCVPSPTTWASAYDRLPSVCPVGLPDGDSLGLVCVIVFQSENDDRHTKAYYITDEETLVELATDDDLQKLWFIIPRTFIRPVCPDFE